MTERELELKQEIEKHGNVPRHVAIIMDGNGRWAKFRGLPRLAGHRAGVEPVRESVRACAELGVEVLTLYAFSVENWNRPQVEINGLMQVLKDTLRREQDELDRNGVQLRTIGRESDLPPDVRRQIDVTRRALDHNDGLVLNLALSYGGRPEILDAVSSIVRAVRSGGADRGHAHGGPTSPAISTRRSCPTRISSSARAGEYRVSNFLLWQIAYTELWVTSTPWPEFRREQLYFGIREFQGRDRRFGRVESLVPEVDG